ncbi:MAG: alanine racemase Alr [Rhodobacteraceae bacterium HLUCCA12]|nr:MAG: alanine racemase Alr [Rhodobacteraceae bacterium HLUCCA12]
MGSARLTIDLNAIAANWQRLDRLSRCETGATVKADAYGLGAAQVVRKLAQAGARKFFIALAEEGATIRQALGNGPDIYVYSGHMAGDAQMLRNLALTPLINSAEQLARHLEALPGHPFGIQLDTGMNRLGMEPREWAAVRDIALEAGPRLIQSHLACSDEPDHLMNGQQADEFHAMTEGCAVPKSLAATGGILMGQAFHFDLTRPGIGLYGGAPFAEAYPVTQLALPVIQTRDVEPGEAVGYSATWIAGRPTRLATVAAGYADGILRHLSNRATLWAGDTPCPVVGRVSMDLITVDVSHLPTVPEALDLLGAHQGIDDLARAAGTIGYEILTSLGPRYRRRFEGLTA